MRFHYVLTDKDINLVNEYLTTIVRPYVTFHNLEKEYTLRPPIGFCISSSSILELVFNIHHNH